MKEAQNKSVVFKGTNVFRKLKIRSWPPKGHGNTTGIWVTMKNGLKRACKPLLFGANSLTSGKTEVFRKG